MFDLLRNWTVDAFAADSGRKRAVFCPWGGVKYLILSKIIYLLIAAEEDADSSISSVAFFVPAVHPPLGACVAGVFPIAKSRCREE